MRIKTLAAALAGAALVLAAPAYAETDIQWWHSMTGALGDRVNDIANKFNASQSEYKVVPVYKGGYAESMTAAIAAYRAGNPPDIVQVFEVGTATMMAAKGAIKPVYQVMARSGREVRPEGLHAGGGQLLQRSLRAACCRCRSTARPRCSTSTRTRSRRRASTRPTRPRPGTRWARRRPSSRPRARCPAPSPPPGSPGCSLRRMSAWHNVAVRTAGQRLRRPGAPSWSSTTRRIVRAHRRARRVGQGRPLHLRRPHRRSPRPSSLAASARCSPARRRPTATSRRTRSSSSAIVDAAVRRRSSRARRRTRSSAAPACGCSPAEAEVALQGHREVLHLPVLARDPGRVAPGHRLRADHQGRLRAEQEARASTRRTPAPTSRSSSCSSSNPTKVSKGMRLGNFAQIRNIIDEELEAVWTGKKTAKAGARRGGQARRRANCASSSAPTSG